MKDELAKDSLAVSAANRTRRHKELLGLLKEAVKKRDAGALKRFNQKRPEYKLTDLERCVSMVKTSIMIRLLFHFVSLHITRKRYSNANKGHTWKVSLSLNIS